MSNYLLINAFVVGLVVAGANGLQVDQSKGHFISANLIHRDSPLSPFYNSSKSKAEIFGEAVTRSLHRINYMNSPMHIDAEDMESDMISNNFGDYFVKIDSGEEEFFLMISMGAAFTWINSLNCDSSSKKNNLLHSYEMLRYGSMDCLISPKTYSVTDNQGSEICHYETSFRDNAVSKGVVSQAAFHLDQSDDTKALFRLMFGCSHSFIDESFQGIIGLGYGDFPFVAQIASQLAGMKEKISYCLPPFHSVDSVKITFGEKLATRDDISNERVTLPFRIKTNSPYYYLTLQSVGYNDKYTDDLTSRHNMVIDCGTTMTTLDEKIFNDLVGIMSDAWVLGNDHQKKSEFCYHIDDEATFNDSDIRFRFDGGTLTLRVKDIFAEHPKMKNIKCMMIKPTKHGPMVLGNYAQINHLVEFHLISNEISFVRANCKKEF